MKEWMLSIIAPGLGQIAQGSWGYGLIYMVCVPTLYWLSWPLGLAAHIWCAVDSWGMRVVDPCFKSRPVFGMKVKVSNNHCNQEGHGRST